MPNSMKFTAFSEKIKPKSGTNEEITEILVNVFTQNQGSRSLTTQ